MLRARCSFSTAALCGAPVPSASASARATPSQQHRRQRLDAAADVLSSSSVGLRMPRRRRRCPSSVFAVQASAAQSTELPPELKRIVVAFSMVRSLRSLVERKRVEFEIREILCSLFFDAPPSHDELPPPPPPKKKT